MTARIGAVAATLIALSVPAPQAGLSGAWAAVRVNKEALPMTDRVVGQDRFTHVIRLIGMTIRLRADGHFQAALRYRRAILSKGERIDNVPLQSDNWTGTYTLTGSHVHFVPARQGAQHVEPFEGDVAGRRITVGFDYEIVTRKHYVLDLDRDDSIF